MTGKRRKDALRAIKDEIAEKYSDPHRRKQELAKALDKQDRDYRKAMLDWQKQNQVLERKLAALDAKINTERIVGDENARSVEVRQHNEDVRQAERQQAEQQRALRQQIEADKAAARKAKQDRRPEERSTTAPATAYRQELNKRRTYWRAATRGDWEHARQTYPNADHEQNRRDIEALIPQSHSKTNEKAYAAALKQLQYEAP
jgi:hypothetical protein